MTCHLTIINRSTVYLKFRSKNTWDDFDNLLIANEWYFQARNKYNEQKQQAQGEPHCVDDWCLDTRKTRKETTTKDAHRWRATRKQKPKARTLEARTTQRKLRTCSSGSNIQQDTLPHIDGWHSWRVLLGLRLTLQDESTPMASGTSPPPSSLLLIHRCLIFECWVFKIRLYYRDRMQRRKALVELYKRRKPRHDWSPMWDVGSFHGLTTTSSLNSCQQQHTPKNPLRASSEPKSC